MWRYPFFSSFAPYTILASLLQYIAPQHIRQGSIVTYKLAVVKYFAPRELQAEVMASISACAVGSFNNSTWLYAFEMILLFITTTAPTGTSSFSKAYRACFNACCIKYSSL